MQNSGEQTASANCRCRSIESGYRKGSALQNRRSISCQILTIFVAIPCGFASLLNESILSLVEALTIPYNSPLFMTSIQHTSSTHFFVSFLFSSLYTVSSELCALPQEEIFPQFLFSHSFMIVSRSWFTKSPVNQQTPDFYITVIKGHCWRYLFCLS